MEESKTEIDFKPDFDFPFDLNKLMNLQFETLKDAIEYLARQQKKLGDQMKDLQEMAFNMDGPVNVEAGGAEAPVTQIIKEVVVQPLEIKGDNNNVDIVEFNAQITQVMK